MFSCVIAMFTGMLTGFDNLDCYSKPYRLVLFYIY